MLNRPALGPAISVCDESPVRSSVMVPERAHGFKNAANRDALSGPEVHDSRQFQVDGTAISGIVSVRETTSPTSTHRAGVRRSGICQ